LFYYLFFLFWFFFKYLFTYKVAENIIKKLKENDTENDYFSTAIKKKKLHIDPIYNKICTNISQKYQTLRAEKIKQKEKEKDNQNENQLSLLENMIVDGHELNFMKQVVIEVFKQKNVITLMFLHCWICFNMMKQKYLWMSKEKNMKSFLKNMD